jgi:hypothetical protein
MFVAYVPLSAQGRYGYLTRLGLDGSYVSGVMITKTAAFEAVGPHLWTVTDSIAYKRNVTDWSIVAQFPIKPVLSLGGDPYIISGMTIHEAHLYIAARFEGELGVYGRIFRFDTSGTYIANKLSKSFVKDLAVLGERLFCVATSHSFNELENRFPYSEARSVKTITLNAAPRCTKLAGIAYYAGKLYLADDCSGSLTIFSVSLPTPP